MSPIAKQVIRALIRVAVVWLAGWLTAHAGVTLTEEQIGKVVTYATPVVFVVGWSVYEKYRDRLKLLTAMTMPRGVTEHEVEAKVADGKVPPVNTPKDQAPRV